MGDNSGKKSGKSKPGRPMTRHGGYSLLTRGDLPEGRKYLRPYLSGVREGLVRDLGPREEDLSTAQRVLIDRAVTFLGVVRLIEEHVKEKGIHDSQGTLNPALGVHYLAFNRTIKEILALLGIERRQGEKILSPLEIAAEIDAEKAEAAKKRDEGPVGERSQGGEGQGEAGNR